MVEQIITKLHEALEQMSVAAGGQIDIERRLVVCHSTPTA